MRMCEHCRGIGYPFGEPCRVCHGAGWIYVDYEAEWHEVQHRARMQYEAERKHKDGKGE